MPSEFISTSMTITGNWSLKMELDALVGCIAMFVSALNVKQRVSEDVWRTCQRRQCSERHSLRQRPVRPLYHVVHRPHNRPLYTCPTHLSHPFPENARKEKRRRGEWTGRAHRHCTHHPTIPVPAAVPQVLCSTWCALPNTPWKHVYGSENLRRPAEPRQGHACNHRKIAVFASPIRTSAWHSSADNRASAASSEGSTSQCPSQCVQASDIPQGCGWGVKLVRVTSQIRGMAWRGVAWHGLIECVVRVRRQVSGPPRDRLASPAV